MKHNLASRLTLAGLAASLSSFVMLAPAAAQDASDLAQAVRSMPLGAAQGTSPVTARPPHTAFPADILARMRAEIIARTRRPAARSANTPTQR